MKNNLYPRLLLALTLAVPAVARQSPSRADYVPLKIIQTEEVSFPMRFLNSGIMNGEARVIIQVDEQDRLEDWLVTGYSRKEFADEAVNALKKWKYQSTKLRGEKWGAVHEINFYFSRTGVLTSLAGGEMMEYFNEQKMPTTAALNVCKLSELDRIPVPSKVVSPGYPKELIDQGVKGKVVVEFYIDETGKVRMPGVMDWSNESLATLAVAAVSQWEFEPPLRQGKPVLLLVRQEFSFAPK